MSEHEERHEHEVRYEHGQEKEYDDTGLAPLPDDVNPAIFHAHQTFVLSLITAVLFIGAVSIFIL